MHFASLLFVIPFTPVLAWPLALYHPLQPCPVYIKMPDCKNPSMVRVHRSATRDLRVAMDGLAPLSTISPLLTSLQATNK